MAKYEGITAELSRVLEDFAEDEREKVVEAVSKAAKQCKKDIVAASPRDTGAYAKGWSVRVKKGRTSVDAIVYNRTHPGLTHVLEQSHVIKNQYGAWGRSTPQVHIKPAADAASEYLLDLLTKDL